MLAAPQLQSRDGIPIAISYCCLHGTDVSRLALELELERGVCFLDIETTGLNMETARIVSVGAVRIDPAKPEEQREWLVNPEVPIPPEASEVHGIRDEHVRGERTFREVAPEIAEFIGDRDLMGYNVRFDLRILQRQFREAGQRFDLEGRYVVDVKEVDMVLRPRRLEDVYRHYVGREPSETHSALGDARMTVEILDAMLRKHKEIPRNPRRTAREFLRHRDAVGYLRLGERGELIFNFGKHAGRCVEEVARCDRGYLEWMMNGDFPSETKEMVAEYLRGAKRDPAGDTDGAGG